MVIVAPEATRVVPPPLNPAPVQSSAPVTVIVPSPPKLPAESVRPAVVEFSSTVNMPAVIASVPDEVRLCNS